jgi:hypothetical protein
MLPMLLILGVRGGGLGIHGAWYGIAQGCHVAEQCRDTVQFHAQEWITAICSSLSTYPLLLSKRSELHSFSLSGVE